MKVLALLLLVACGGSKPPPTTGSSTSTRLTLNVSSPSPPSSTSVPVLAVLERRS